jgi:hypothetical protein
VSPRALFFLVAPFPLAACVPTGSAPPYDAGAAPALSSSFKPSTNIMTAPFEDDFERPDGGEAPSPLASASAAASASARGAAVHADARTFGLDAGDGTRDAMAVGDAMTLLAVSADGGSEASMLHANNLGPNWTQMRTNAWRIESGRLCGENAHNHGVWLNRTLPINARIEFDAYAYTDTGDLKAEVWGDGHSYATSTSYTMATSYLAILGGWKNTEHVLARLNEHGSDRKEIKVDKDADDPRQRAVVRGQLYQFKIERTDGKTIRVTVNGNEYFAWADTAPLTGYGHDHFGFNEWEAKVCFDNVKVTPLGV